jgi:hypothetical protein
MGEIENNFNIQEYDYMEKSEKIINIVYTILKEIISENINVNKKNVNKKNVNKKNSDSKKFQIKDKLSNDEKIFDSKEIPQISLKKYLSRILKYAKPQPSSIIISLILIDKICEHSKINLNQKNIHKIFLTSIIIAIKYNEDEYFTNNYYSKVGGILEKELFHLEYTFLKILNFNVFIDETIYENYYNKLDNI